MVLSELMPNVDLFRKLSQVWRQGELTDNNTANDDADTDEILYRDNNNGENDLNSHNISNATSNLIDEAIAKLFIASS